MEQNTVLLLEKLIMVHFLRTICIHKTVGKLRIIYNIIYNLIYYIDFPSIVREISDFSNFDLFIWKSKHEK